MKNFYSYESKNCTEKDESETELINIESLGKYLRLIMQIYRTDKYCCKEIGLAQGEGR